MKIQIDTDNKTITIEGSILLKDLITTLNALFPSDTWKHFTLIQSKITEWINITPIVYPYPWITYPYPITTYGTSNHDGTNDNLTVNYNSGIYNLEINN